MANIEIMMQQYEAPILTKYGKVENFIQAGSVALQSGDISVALESGDITGDGTPDQAFDTNGDGKADVIVGGANGGTTPVHFIQNIIGQISYNGRGSGSLGDSVDFYDSDGDCLADFAIADLNTANPTLQTIDSQKLDNVTLSGEGFFYNYDPYRYEYDGVGISGNTETSSNGGWNDPSRD